MAFWLRETQAMPDRKRAELNRIFIFSCLKSGLKCLVNRKKKPLGRGERNRRWRLVHGFSGLKKSCGQFLGQPASAQ